MTRARTAYSANVLQQILGNPQHRAARLPFHELRDDGLWLKPEWVGAEAGHTLTPSDVEAMQWQPKPDPDAAALPIPFTARDLAAFTLAGGGVFLLERFDDGNGFPDNDGLQQLGANGDKARHAIRRALALRQAALKRFGRDDSGAREAALYLTQVRPAEAREWAISAMTPIPAAHEEPEARRARRLLRFFDLGGEMLPNSDGWRLGGRRGALAALVREEKAACQSMSGRQDVTRELHAAMAGYRRS